MPCAPGQRSRAGLASAVAFGQDGCVLAVLTLLAGSWKILALENVTLTNPRTGETVLRDRAAM
ncbi:MAG: hypothetical protein JWP41_2442 [Ramlibacter sp.]|nr:hypothetical protein [Ramlibacter sp.]